MTLLLKYDFSAAPGPVVYAAQIDQGGPIRIGYARQLRKHYLALQEELPFPLCVLGAKMFENERDARQFETALKAQLAEHRIHGGWFKPGPWVEELTRTFAPLPMTAKAVTMRWEDWTPPPETLRVRRRTRRHRYPNFVVSPTWQEIKKTVSGAP